jgi:hypothetical protein
VEVLARLAAHLGDARGLWKVPTSDGERHFAITDPKPPDTSVDTMVAALETSADMIQQLVLRQDRYTVMRAIVLGLFKQAGLVPLFVGEPQMLMGTWVFTNYGVYFSVDGTVNGVAFGLQGDLG